MCQVTLSSLNCSVQLRAELSRDRELPLHCCVDSRTCVDLSETVWDCFEEDGGAKQRLSTNSHMHRSVIKQLTCVVSYLPGKHYPPLEAAKQASSCLRHVINSLQSRLLSKRNRQGGGRRQPVVGPALSLGKFGSSQMHTAQHVSLSVGPPKLNTVLNLHPCICEQDQLRLLHGTCTYLF